MPDKTTGVSLEHFIAQHIADNGQDVQLPVDVVDEAYEKDFVITKFGATENCLFFLREGIVEVATAKDGERRILEFVFPGTFFCAYTSYLQQQPSDVELVTVTRCAVSKIRRHEMEDAMKTSLLANQLGLYIARQMFLARARREKDFLTLTAEERYMALMQKAPEVIRVIPVNKIAKYLGIQPESLSRIRKNLIP